MHIEYNKYLRKSGHREVRGNGRKEQDLQRGGSSDSHTFLEPLTYMR